MRAAAAVLAFFACATVSAAEPAPATARFSGSASLNTPLPHSADQRFVLDAELRPNRMQQSGRFALRARLLPDAKAINAVCGPLGDLVFADGFESVAVNGPVP